MACSSSLSCRSPASQGPRALHPAGRHSDDAEPAFGEWTFVQRVGALAKNSLCRAASGTYRTSLSSVAKPLSVQSVQSFQPPHTRHVSVVSTGCKRGGPEAALGGDLQGAPQPRTAAVRSTAVNRPSMQLIRALHIAIGLSSSMFERTVSADRDVLMTAALRSSCGPRMRAALRCATALAMLVLGWAPTLLDALLVEGCDPATCRLPSCQCAQPQPPAGLAVQETPQFVMFTLDDGFSSTVLDLIRPCVTSFLCLLSLFCMYALRGHGTLRTHRSA